MFWIFRARKVQKLPAECSSNGSCQSHPALAESSRTPTSVACPRLLQCGASAGHVVDYNVMDMMVGIRRATGATILGGRARVPHLPTITFVSRRRVLYFVMGGPVGSVRDGVLPDL